MKTWFILPMGLIAGMLLTACSSTSPLEKDEPSDSVKAAKINVQLGLGYLQRGQKQAAYEKLSRAVELDPRSPLANHAFALLEDVLGETDKAEEYFRRAADLDPKNPEILNNFGAFLCRQKKTDEGVGLLERAASNPLYTTPEFAWANVGQCRRQAKQLKEAETALYKAVQINPRHAAGWLQLSEVQLELGQPIKATTSLQRFHELAAQTPGSLFLGARIESSLKHRDAQAHYELLLRGKFPDSEEARRLGDLSQ